MKRVLGIMAAGVLVMTSFQAAHAADASTTNSSSVTTSTTMAPTMAAPEASAVMTTKESASTTVSSTTVKSGPQILTLKDGASLTVDGDAAYTLDASGNKVPAADGDHVLADGKTVTTAAGKVTAGLPEMGEPAAGTATTTTTTIKTDKTSTPE
jgi:hypothetical protein